MKIMVTGALGHIGSKIIHSIKPGQFEEVRLLDNFLTQRYCSLFNLPAGVNFTFIEENINTADLDVRFAGIDIVIHLAAITDAASSFDKQEQVEEVNYRGTEKVAKACIKNGCKLIFPSTTSVYGTQDEVVDESCSIDQLKPQSPYAGSKLKAEQLLTRLGQKSNLAFVICRLGTIFGTSIGMRFHTAVNKFVWQACLGQPITVWRTALNQKRPYLDLKDAVRAAFFIIDRDLFDQSIYNVVTINATVGDIVNAIRDSMSAPVHVQYVDSKIMNQLSYNVRNERFKKTGFGFSGDLREGIRETINMLNGIKHS
ncbi:MAG: SDR family oxidoreductase [Syntrophales bacterium]|nr:SDR family oxidoreductase [Syntrophales bacterium]